MSKEFEGLDGLTVEGADIGGHFVNLVIGEQRFEGTVTYMFDYNLLKALKTGIREEGEDDFSLGRSYGVIATKATSGRAGY